LDQQFRFGREQRFSDGSSLFGNLCAMGSAITTELNLIFVFGISVEEGLDL